MDLNIIAEKITEKLQIEKIALSRATVSRDCNDEIIVTIFEGVGAIQTEFALFDMSNKVVGWICSIQPRMLLYQLATLHY